MSGALYVDASAFVKLVVPERETPALREALQASALLVSSELLVVESLRACGRYGPEYREGARQALLDVALIPLTRELLVAAGDLAPMQLHSLDAVHLASALSRAAHLDGLVGYDERLNEAATAVGLRCLSPGRG